MEAHRHPSSRCSGGEILGAPAAAAAVVLGVVVRITVGKPGLTVPEAAAAWAGAAAGATITSREAEEGGGHRRTESCEEFEARLFRSRTGPPLLCQGKLCLVGMAVIIVAAAGIIPTWVLSLGEARHRLSTTAEESLVSVEVVLTIGRTVPCWSHDYRPVAARQRQLRVPTVPMKRRRWTPWNRYRGVVVTGLMPQVVLHLLRRLPPCILLAFEGLAAAAAVAATAAVIIIREAAGGILQFQGRLRR